MALAVLAGLAYAMIRLWSDGQLPPPFFDRPDQVRMDWFNTAAWARDAGMYDVWGAIYPPLTFVVLRIVGLPGCYAGGGEAADAARACDWVGVAALHAIFVVNAVLIAMTFWRIDPRTALPRAVALSAGLPMTAALDRGNLILLAFTGLVLGFGPLLRSARWRWLAVACAVNFKPYLVAAVFPQLLRRRWRWFEGAAVAIALVYVGSFALLGRGTPQEIVANIARFAGDPANEPLGLWYAFTYAPTLARLAVTTPAGSILAELLPLVRNGVQLGIILAAVAAWTRPEAVPMYRLTNLGLCLALVTSEAGGYAAMLPILFVFMEPWRGVGRRWAILACYVICMPVDLTVRGIPLRPLINLSIPLALSLVTLAEVGADIRERRWRTRRRFRRDLPILKGPGAGDAIRPE